VTVTLEGARAVLLPGTGSDDDYVRRVFGEPLRHAGAELIAVAPQPADLVRGYLRALDEAAATGPILVGGISLGAAVAVRWALRNPDRVSAVLAALPAWSGEPGDAPAAVSARHTAGLLRRDGLPATTATMRESSPGWLADELSRSWRAQWPALPDALEAAAGYVGPTADELGTLTVPLGVVGVPDDPIHPVAVARQWADAAPRAALRTIELAEFGPRPAALGRTCLAALLAAPV